jgi:site-specific DNA recombinase
MRKGIIYTRVSSDEQIKGTSLDFQEEICRNYCKDRNIEVLEVFREEGASAKSADRKEFLRAIEFCRKNKGKVEAFVVAKVDRFARNTEDHFYVRKMLIDYGVTLHSVTEPIGNNPTEKFLETVLAGSAEFDNAVRRQRCVDGMIAKINQGIFPWKAPIGYACSNAKRRGEKKNEPDQPDENIFPIIQRGLKEYARGQVSQSELARLFDRWGLARHRSKKATPQFVNGLFFKHLKFYAGILVNPWANGEETRGAHKPMINEEEYHRILLRLSGKTVKVSHHRLNPNFRLRKTALCGECLRPLTGSLSKGRSQQYGYYHCFNRDCDMYGKGISKEKLEEDFVLRLQDISPGKKFMAMLSATVLDTWKEQGRHFEAEAKRYEKQITLLEDKRKRVFEMREDGSYSREEFAERKSAVESELAALRISRSEARIEQFDLEGALAYAERFMADLGRQWRDLPPHLAPRFQKLVFPQGIPYVRNDGFGTAEMGLIFRMNEALDAQTSDVVDPSGFEPLASCVQSRRSTK